MQSHRQRQRPYQDYRTDDGNTHKTVFGVHRWLSYVFGVSEIESHRLQVNKLSRIEHSNRTRQPRRPLATAPASHGAGEPTPQFYAFGTSPPGVSLSMALGSALVSFANRSLALTPTFVASCETVSAPSAWCS